MQVSYLFEGKSHTDYSDGYMSALGMDDEQKEFTLSMQQVQLDNAAKAIREQRDIKMATAVSWLERHKSEAALSIDHVLACTELDLHGYMQQLRDVPQQSGFPLNVDWPALGVSHA